MPKYEKIATLVAQRIKRGDYALHGLPAEEKLASEVGASRMTARKALEHLASLGMIRRDQTGRRVIDAQHVPALDRCVAMLMPAYASPFLQALQSAIEYVVADHGGVLRPIGYVHMDDPIVYDTLTSFDATFFLLQPEPIPERLRQHLNDSSKRIVGFGQGFADLNLPCIEFLPPRFVQILLDHVHDQGHQQIACLNVQPIGLSEQRRIEQWQVWHQAHKTEGQLINEPVELFGRAMPQAHRVMGRLLDAKSFNDTAVFCLTESAAIGAARAMLERGVHPGRDIAVCTVAELGHNRFMWPSITAIELPDPRPYIRQAFDWMVAEQREPWDAHTLSPVTPPLFIGESTAAPDRDAPLLNAATSST